MKTTLWVTIVMWLLSGCAEINEIENGKPRSNSQVTDLPEKISNNATALIEHSDHYKIVSMAGLVNGTTWRHVANDVWVFDSRRGRWTQAPSLPVNAGRLAGTAATIGQRVIYFGGYTVAEDGSEISTPEVFAFDPAASTYQTLPNMPVPVDDTVSAIFQNRFVYLISGWHDDDNVNNVQVLDTETLTWAQATPYPGQSVFGHAGGLANNTLVICDGVTVKQPEDPDGRRSFSATNACFTGQIDSVDPVRINWQQIAPHPGKSLYRSAATGIGDLVVFAGGSETPYNFDGIGYDQQPAQPSTRVHAWNTKTRQWISLPALAVPSMDHRNLLSRGNGDMFLIGGMGKEQTLRSAVTHYMLSPTHE